MRISDRSLRPVFAVAVGAFILGLAVPAGAREVAKAINGKSIALHSTPGNRLQDHTLTRRQIKRHGITGDRLKSGTVTGEQVRESTLGTVPLADKALSVPPLVWHPVSDTDMLHNWASYTSGSFRQVAYAKDADGIIHLRGDLAGGSSGQVAFTLPAGFAPSALITVPVEANEGVGELFVGTNGEVTPQNQSGTNPDVGVNLFTSLEGASFSS